MSDLLMNVHICVNDNTIYPMLYVRSLRQIKRRMYTHVLLIPLITPCCMSDHYARYNHQCTHMCYWKHYQNHVVCQINMSDLMMNVNTCCMLDHYVWFNDEHRHMFCWLYYLHHGVYHINVSDLMVNVHTCATDNTT